MPVSVYLSDDKTHLIYELQDPLDMKQLLDAYDEEKIYRDSLGLKMMTEMILKMTQYDRMKFFDTREEADGYIAELTMKVQTEDPS